MEDSSTPRLAERLKLLRQERGWSLDQLAERSGVSRAALSRLENGTVSPTTEVLGKLCRAYGLTLTRLLAMVEQAYRPIVPRAAQTLWRDEATGFTRRSVSPPATALAAEVLECTLAPDTHITYDGPPVPGQEHHLLLREGALEVRIDGQAHRLQPGDCLRYQLHGPSEFHTPPKAGASYILVLV